MRNDVTETRTSRRLPRLLGRRNSRPLRILSIDGGGIRGLLPVMVLRTNTSLKISIGSNPWAPERRNHDIAVLCQRFGGGGHAADVA